MDNLIKEGLSSVNKESILQRKILDASLRSDDYAFNYLSSLYKDVSSNTDSICNSLLEKDDIISLINNVEKKSHSIYGNNWENYYFPLSSILSMCLIKSRENDNNISSLCIVEEAKNIFHHLLLERYSTQNLPFYLHNISLNIFNSFSLRKLMCGDIDSYNKYSNYDSGLNSTEFMVCNDTIGILASLAMDNLNKYTYYNGIFLKDENIRNQVEIEKLKLASYYVLAKERGFDIRVDASDINDIALSYINAAANIGEDYCVKEMIKVRR